MPRLTRDQVPQGLHIGVGITSFFIMGKLTIARERLMRSLTFFGPNNTRLSYFVLSNDI
jgi:hypothetical protein